MPPTLERPGGRTARVRAAVLDATLALLRDEGFAAITFDAVAKRSGIHRTTLHRRWPSRAALVADALAESSAQQVPVPDTGSLTGDLRAFARSVRGAITSRSSRGIASALADPAVAGELAQVTQRFWSARFEAARILVERAQARNELPASTDPVFVIELVGGPIWFRTLVVGRRADDHFLDRVVDTAVKGLAPRANRSRR
jgi:AcrR family transcriptional regulator